MTNDIQPIWCRKLLIPAAALACAVMSGEVNMGFFNTPTVISQIRDGKLRALAVTSLTRSPLLPNLPTLDEQGAKVD